MGRGWRGVGGVRTGEGGGGATSQVLSGWSLPGFFKTRGGPHPPRGPCPNPRGRGPADHPPLPGSFLKETLPVAFIASLTQYSVILHGKQTVWVGLCILLPSGGRGGHGSSGVLHSPEEKDGPILNQ